MRGSGARGPKLLRPEGRLFRLHYLKTTMILCCLPIREVLVCGVLLRRVQRCLLQGEIVIIQYIVEFFSGNWLTLVGTGSIQHE